MSRPLDPYPEDLADLHRKLQRLKETEKYIQDPDERKNRGLHTILSMEELTWLNEIYQKVRIIQNQMMESKEVPLEKLA